MERVLSKAEPKPFGPRFSRTLISSLCTELLFPPHFGSPQVTTWPSVKIAAKALSVPVTFTTCCNCSFTPVPGYNFRFLSLKFAKTLWRVSFCFFVDEVPNGQTHCHQLHELFHLLLPLYYELFHLLLPLLLSFICLFMLTSQKLSSKQMYIENRKPSSVTNWMKL